MSGPAMVADMTKHPTRHLGGRAGKISASWLRHLQAFHAVIETGSTTAAARRLYVTQPAISNLLSKLELYIGFSLFDRKGSRLIPTQEAIYLHEHVKTIIQKFDILPSTIQDIRDMHVGQIRLAIFPGASLTVMPEIIADFRSSYPRVAVSMQTILSTNVHLWTAEAPFDLALAELPQLYGDVDVEEFVMRCGCLMPREHPLCALDVIRPQDLAGESLISLFDSHMTSLELERAFVAAGVERNVTVEVSFFAIACALVKNRVGIAIVDPINGNFYSDDSVTIRPFEPSISMRIGLLFPANKSRSRIVEAFAEKLRSFLEKACNGYSCTPPPCA